MPATIGGKLTSCFSILGEIHTEDPSGRSDEAFRQGVEPRLVVSLKRLAALGRNLVNLIPSGEALAMEQEHDESWPGCG